jgi:SAM-dependent methyltransferase
MLLVIPFECAIMQIFKKIKTYFYQQNFQPGLLGLFINPFYFVRRGLFVHLRKIAHYIHGDVLDVGCGRKPYGALFNVKQYIGMDVEVSGHAHENSEVDIYYDGRTFPFTAGSFDSVIMTEVLEHTFDPDAMLSEANRVLRQNGFLLLTVPFIWIEHEQPYDFARYSSFGLKYLMDKHGFEMIVLEKSVSDIRLIFQLLILYCLNKGVKKSLFFRIGVAILFSPLTIIAEVLSLILPEYSDLYLTNVVLAKKK